MALVGRFRQLDCPRFKEPADLDQPDRRGGGVRRNATDILRHSARERITKQVEQITMMVNDILDLPSGGAVKLELAKLTMPPLSKPWWKNSEAIWPASP